MKPEKTINQHLDTSEQDDTEAPENEGMEEPDHRPPEDLGLPDRNFQHDLHSFGEIRYGESGFGKLKKADDTAGSITKDSGCNQQG